MITFGTKVKILEKGFYNGVHGIVTSAYPDNGEATQYTITLYPFEANRITTVAAENVEVVLPLVPPYIVAAGQIVR